MRSLAEAEDHGARRIFLDASQAAALLNVSPKTLLRWARQGIVPAHPLSGNKRRNWRFLQAELDAWALSRVNSNSRLVPEFKEQ